MSAKIKIIDNDISKVIASVSVILNIPISKIKGYYRGKHESAARHIAMGLIFNRNHIGLEKVGKIFNRNHATVIYGIKKFNDVVDNPKRNSMLSEKINKVMEVLN